MRGPARLFGITLAVLSPMAMGGCADSSSSGGSSNSSSSSSSHVKLVARRSSCLQLPELAKVTFILYVKNTGSTAAKYGDDITPEWTTIDAHKVFSAQNTVTLASKVRAHSFKRFRADLPADGTKPIISCQALIGDREVHIPIQNSG